MKSIVSLVAFVQGWEGTTNIPGLVALRRIRTFVRPPRGRRPYRFCQNFSVVSGGSARREYTYEWHGKGDQVGCNRLYKQTVISCITRTGVQRLLNNVAHLLGNVVDGKLFTNISSLVRLS